MKSKLGILENQLSNIRQEKSQLLATLELEQAKLETLEEGQHRYLMVFFSELFIYIHFTRDSAKLETLRASFQQTIDNLRKEKVSFK